MRGKKRGRESWGGTERKTERERERETQYQSIPVKEY
jgi:hypothetical protein